jgi:hypothetical protein
VRSYFDRGDGVFFAIIVVAMVALYLVLCS